MRYLSCTLIFVSCVAICLGQNYSAKILSPNLYVAPDGNDSNPGTIDKAFATLAGARNAVREFKKGVTKPITVFVREGTYYLKEPLVFGPEDSRTDLQPITYAAYPGEKPTISGGVKLNAQYSRWKPFRDGIMKCWVPNRFDQLFINGKRQIRARFPNFNPEKPLVGQGGYLNVALAGEGKVFYDPEKFTKNRWSKPSEAIIHIYQNHYWYNLQYWIKDMDWDSHAIIFGRGGWQKRNNLSPSSSLFNTDSRFFIENVFEELDTPGEWYLDTEKNILYYKPAQGMDLSGAKVEAGVLKRLIEFKGSRQNPVRHINLIGFRFAHTATTYLEKYEPASNGDWGIHRGGAVFFEGAQDCAVENSFFDAVGGNAVFISNHNRRIRVYGNKFTETGDSLDSHGGGMC